MMKVKIRIAICDGIKRDRDQIIRFCRTYLCDKKIEYEIKEYASGETLLVEVFPDVLFLDMDVSCIDGILIKEILHKMHAQTKIVFVSSQKHRMQEAFGKNVYAFMEKPICYSVFYEKMSSVFNDVLEEKNTIFCKNNQSIEKVYLRDVVYIKAYGRYTKLFINKDGEYRISDRSFSEWYLEMENCEFLCCHRSYLVNLLYIKCIAKEIELVNGWKIPFGPKKKTEFLESYKAYIRRR